MNYTITEIATIVKAQKRAYKDYTITATEKEYETSWWNIG